MSNIAKLPTEKHATILLLRNVEGDKSAFHLLKYKSGSLSIKKLGAFQAFTHIRLTKYRSKVNDQSQLIRSQTICLAPLSSGQLGYKRSAASHYGERWSREQ